MMSPTSPPSTVKTPSPNSANQMIISSFSLKIVDIIADIRNWIRNIEQHASDNVNKILVGNKADMDESKRVLI